MSALTGTGVLLRFALRRNRWWWPAWVGGLASYTVLLGASVVGMYPDEADRIGGARTIDNPGSTFLIGPRYGPDNYPSAIIVGHQTLLFVSIVMAVFAMLTMARHTRAEEDAGRAELVLSARVGRAAPLVTALLVTLSGVVVASLVVAVAFLGLGHGIDRAGALVYGLGVAGVGFTFAGGAAVAAQVASSTRGMNTLVGLGLATTFVLRGVGDVKQNWLGALTTFGWAQRGHPWEDNAWAWPALGVIVGLVLAVLGVALAGRRDLGAGLLPGRAGRSNATAALVSPVGLAARLALPTTMIWTISLALFGLAYGPVLSEADRFLEQMPQLEDVVPGATQAGGVRLFASIIVGMVGLLSAVPGALVISRLVADERAGRSAILHTATGRLRWFGANLLVALASAAVPLVAFGLCFGLSAAKSREDSSLIGDLVGASLGYLPAIAAVITVIALLAGWAPRVVNLGWVMLVHAFVVFYFADLLDWPRWVSWPSVYDHVAARPALEGDTSAQAVITGLVVVGVIVAAVGYRRRALA